MLSGLLFRWDRTMPHTQKNRKAQGRSDVQKRFSHPLVIAVVVAIIGGLGYPIKQCFDGPVDAEKRTLAARVEFAKTFVPELQRFRNAVFPNPSPTNHLIDSVKIRAAIFQHDSSYVTDAAIISARFPAWVGNKFDSLHSSTGRLKELLLAIRYYYNERPFPVLSMRNSIPPLDSLKARFSAECLSAGSV